MVKLETNFNDYRNESTFYFRTMDQCSKFLNVFKDHWCNIPWKKPVEISDNTKIPDYALSRLDIDPEQRAISNLSWGFGMTKYYNIDLSKDQKAIVKSMSERYMKKPKKEEEDKLKNNMIINNEQFKQIFAYGATYGAAVCNPGKFHGSFPVDNIDKALDYVYRLIIKGERDEECLRCQKLKDKTCEGCIDRGREVITEENRCAFYKPLIENDRKLDYSCPEIKETMLGSEFKEVNENE